MQVPIASLGIVVTFFIFALFTVAFQAFHRTNSTKGKSKLS